MGGEFLGLGDIGAGLVIGGVIAVGAQVIWLVGLLMALRGSTPAERAAILRAYALLRVPRGRRRAGE